MSKKVTQYHVGWIMFALFAAFLFLYLLRKKPQPSSVTHQLIYTWDSRTMPVPSFNEAPPFQNPDGSLICAPGYSLWQDSATNNLACYKDPQITSTGTAPVRNPDTLPNAWPGLATGNNIFTGAQLTDEAGNPIPGGT